MELPPFLAPCSSSGVPPACSSSCSSASVSSGIVLAQHHPGGPSQMALPPGPPTCWTLYSQESEPGPGGQSPPVPVSLYVPAPITFHILTTHSAQPAEHYFAALSVPPSEQRHQQQMGLPAAAAHYQPSSLAAHQLQHLGHAQQQQQQPIQVKLQSSAVGPGPNDPTTFVLRQPPPNRKSLSPDISVDEEGGDGGQDGGAGAGQDAAGAQQLQGHTARTPPETLDWLKANYEEFKGASLPRCTLYEHYQSHCREAGLVPVNAASFGKLIRSVFKSLQTRRLGTRGNSKYHYNGIRVKPNSPLAATMSQEEFQRMNAAHQQQAPGHQRGHRRQSTLGQRRISRGGGGGGTSGGGRQGALSSSSSDEQRGVESGQAQQQQGRSAEQSPLYAPAANQQQQQSSFPLNGEQLPPPPPPAPAASASRELSLPEVKLPSLDEGSLLQFGLGLEHGLKFFDDYREHCREVLESVKCCRLESVERLWTTFWQGSGPNGTREERAEGERQDTELGQLRGAPALDQASLFRLCSLPQVLAFVECFDLKFYQLLLDLLFPSPLRLCLPGELCNRVRHLAKSVECWMDKALGPGAPPALRRAKLGTVRLLANCLTRLSSFAHLAITARNVLQNEQQVQQMFEDFNRVDFGVVHWQADWLCAGSHCPAEGQAWVRALVDQFRERLARRCLLEEWADWLEEVADRALATWAGQPPEAQLARGKRFLLGWTFHSSLLLRDITLRSAQSFGQFHLVRLLFDDYLLLTMEQKLAKLTGQDPIALMAPEWLRNGPMAGQNASQQRHFPPIVPQPAPAPPPPPHAQHFYAQMQRQQPPNQFQMVDQLPPPGPEPPLDMLNGAHEETGSSATGRGRTNSTAATIHYVLVHGGEQQPGRDPGQGRLEEADEWEMVEEGEEGREQANGLEAQKLGEAQQLKQRPFGGGQPGGEGS